METTMTDTNIAVGDHRGLLDIIDSLRSQGVSHYVDLPEIIVCGDQSAGKSSVLEAISGMPFPTKDGLCTRFATELVLRRHPEANTKVSITPGETRFGEDKERLENWQPEASIDKEGLGTVTDEAKRAMADPTCTGEFYEDILRIELTGPRQPHLTIVDLPGLFRSGNKEQSDADVGIVRGMVERYMARPRSIILTVVSAKYEYVLQEVTLMAKCADPEGLRTMGLITKPDTLDVGSNSESYFVRLARNLEAELRLGWHVLKNRKFEERHVTSSQRDEIEGKFFSQGLWTSIDSSHCGVAALRVRLSAVLRDQILVQLPSLVQDVEDGIHDCDDRLDRLGPVRGTSQQQWGYLLRLSEEYTSLVTQAVEGTYTDRFFGNRKKFHNFNTRLRAVVQNRLREFAEDMRLSGQSQYIVDSESEGEGSREVRDLPHICRSDYVEDVAKRLKFSKGRELPGLFNPLIVNDLFVEQCEPWGRIVKLLAEDILEAAHQTTQLIVEHITTSDVAEGVLQLVRQGIEGLKVGLDGRVDALLASTAQHPITYNPQLTENVQRIQQARHKRDMKKLVRKTFGAHRFDNPGSKISLNPIELVDLVGEGFEKDMERFGSSLAVAVSRFIDDVSILAIEDCLISKLSTLFRSSNILKMSDQEVSHLAGETQESSLERRRLEEKRNILKTGLQSLKSLNKRRNILTPTEQDQVASEDSDQIGAMIPRKQDLAAASAHASTPFAPSVPPKASRPPAEFDAII
ncbi:P-loop containing nucleoside triphosphate hydrolase protein [Diaporthe amygdali]|uniref:P-loop containing nucleoside triphosphate hydrolase protein n=1 Tax=Phomopsis amygdali TaxID=1214568 RepID=UPI0022FECC26|nr:P-loop containing nucleoside triphosphate hydrolase protein [Diaporthe amygdali]KAJ0107643.1 P-loop containing nucleoside triphosphate hydrolase protein [Diaporthe amygdali]